MTITASSPEKIALDLEFIKPFACRNVAEFTLRPRAGSTSVTWSMRGPHPYLGRVIATFFDIHRMVGRDFERGLANLKQVAEEEQIRLAG